jgi:hypothetical protein
MARQLRPQTLGAKEHSASSQYSRVSFNRCLVQLEGGIVRCPIELLQSEFKRSEYVRDLNS